MKFLRLLTLTVIIALPFFPLQLDTRIIFIIAGFALLLSPVFIKNFTRDFEAKKPVTVFFLLFLTSSTLSTIFSIDRERVKRYGEAAKRGTEFILSTQVTQNNSFKNPKRAIGGFTRSPNENLQRIDYTQHAIMALIKTHNNKIYK